MSFTFDVLPDDLSALKRELWLPRLKVDGVAIEVRSATLDDSDTAAGETLTVELAKLSDVSAFTPTASIEFGIGKRIPSYVFLPTPHQELAWDEATFKTLISGAKVQRINRRIAGTPQNPGDSVSVTIISSTADKLNKTSETGLIIYDPDRETIGDGEIETIYDADGNAYSPELLAVPGLKLSRLLDEVLVNRCGFTGYQTNLPESDYPIQRYQVGMGQRFFDGLKGFIGMFYPAVKEVAGEIWITDTTHAQPSGFPALKSISVDKVTAIETGTEKQKLDALLVRFVGLANNYDFTTFDFQYPIDSDGPLRTETERITVQFRKITTPGNSAVVSEALNIENKRTYLGDVEVDRASDVYEFDDFGRHRLRRKTAHKRMPPLDGTDISQDPFLQKVLDEEESYTYAPHPFRRRSQYLQRREMRRSGVYSIDSDNPLPNGDPYKRDVTTAQQAGNIQDGQTFGDGRLRSRSETAEPLRTGTTRVRVLEIDELNGGIVIQDFQEERSGDISLSAGTQTAKTIAVFAEDNATRSLDRTEDFPIGELPLRYGLPLARRVLVFRQTKGQTLQLDHIGLDESLKKGTAISAYDRAGSALGNFTIAGVSIRIDKTGLIMSLQAREIAGTTEPLQRLAAYGRTIEYGDTLEFTLPIECVAGQSLSCDPATVPYLNVEVSYLDLLGDPTLWFDLGDGPVDLSPFDGETKDFFLRVTAPKLHAPAVEELRRVRFDLVVSE